MIDRETAIRIAELASALTRQERAVADAYLADPLATHVELGRRAGYKGGATRVRKAAQQSLARPRVKAYIEAIMAAGGSPEETAIVKHVIPLIATAEEVKQRLTRISRTSLADVMKFGDDGQWTGEFTFTREGAYTLRELRVERITKGDRTFTKVTPKIDDRLRALQILAQVHGLVQRPDDERRDEVVAQAWARVFARHPEIAKEYHFALLEASTSPVQGPVVDVTPRHVNGNGHNGNGNGHP